ncbi:DNA-binding transcriptional ArsR family regulator [Sphingobium sp. B11D3B]|uniref:ArsR/SmtB family transcription factor n=1 Tax=Sphingobium sp. B11D3B TaxID=2940575 RepID=UPI002227414D|nr:metalloregulator ArsR/SmtB family transcription factor [Sphingobium sp. B11D3B]MCW2390056.1 DNA-binding transcriptional ArsR family regulator [Sphingobium sp. B11D3B]
MERESASEALAALAQPARLATFSVIAEAGDDGLPVGEVARRLNARQNTTSTHLGVLARAHVVTAQRVGKSVIYKVNQDVLGSLIAFLEAFTPKPNGSPKVG